MNDIDALGTIINNRGISDSGKTHLLLSIIAKELLEMNRVTNNTKTTLVSDIKEFHDKFNQTYNGPVRQLPEDMQNFRLKFLIEELEEYEEAVDKADLPLQIDALFDLVYVALGTAYLMGVDFESVWKEGHSSNMSKTLVEKGKGKLGFTVQKGDNYFKPNFEQFVK